jgi:hypothetical protein
MTMLRLSDETIRLARRAGLRLVRVGSMRCDRTWSVRVGDEIAQLVEQWRVKGEHDDGVVSRVILDLSQIGR